MCRATPVRRYTINLFCATNVDLHSKLSSDRVLDLSQDVTLQLSIKVMPGLDYKVFGLKVFNLFVLR